MQATPECFAHLTQLLQLLAGGRVCAVLEVSAQGPGEGRAPDVRVSRDEVFCLVQPLTLVTSLLCPLSTLFLGWLPLGVPSTVSVHDGADTAW